MMVYNCISKIPKNKKGVFTMFRTALRMIILILEIASLALILYSFAGGGNVLTLIGLVVFFISVALDVGQEYGEGR